MVELHQPMSLEELADRCLESLQVLKKNAKDKFHPTTSTRDLLQDFEKSIDGSLLILQRWIRQFTEGRQTHNDDILSPIRQDFRALEQYIVDVDLVLSARLRLRYRRFSWISLTRKKKKLVVMLLPELP